MKKLVLITLACSLAAALSACQRTPGEVVDKVLVDFGVREKPEGYVSGSDKVFDKLADVGKAEIKRLNQANRNGEVKFQDDQGLRGKYYKETKVYENFYPLDVQATSRGSDTDRGYVGFIEFEYRMYQSERKSSRAEAAAASATIPAGEPGRDTFRYHFNGGGAWDGAKGETSRR